MIHRTHQFVGLALLLAACGVEESAPTWTVDHTEDAGALLSVWGSGPSDVWAAGGQAGDGLLLHNDGGGWTEVATDADQLLSWVYGFHADDVYAVGENGLVMHFDGAVWQRVESGTDQNLYGIWGESGDEVWIVGGDPFGPAGSAVLLRGSGDDFEVVDDVPAQLLPSALYKIYGSPQGLVAVGSSGTILRHELGEWSRDPAPTTQPLFSLWGRTASDMYAVGGYGQGDILHFDGEAWNTVNADIFHRGLSGVFTAPGQPTIAVGSDAYIVELDEDGTEFEPELPELASIPEFHGVWGDGTGTTYAVGGDLLAYPHHMGGVILRRD